ncbi:MAG TPA: von Willebrand factor type A domain-containing protein [Lacunisphaera sp.]|nr:von Willebrand factor type A domain-containing protein [Lacunisphaera sp.]
MEANKISPEDPRLTAYALNEMPAAERAEFEKLLEQDPAARALADDIAATASLLAAALEDEPVEAAPKPAPKREPLPRIVRFPYWTISSLAAACFALFFIYWQRNEMMPPAKQYIEVPLAPPAEPAANAAKTEPASTEEATKLRYDDSAEATRASERDAASLRQAEKAAELKKDAGEAFRGAPVAAPAPKVAAADIIRASRPAPAGPVPAQNQAARPASAAAGTLKAESEAVVLSPFEVSAPAQSRGYAGSSTLAGKRVNSGVTWRTETKELRVPQAPALRDGNTEAYAFRRDNDYKRVKDEPLSTFSVDVDTASYANVRRFLTTGERPPADAVRIEELVNYFPYDYEAPADPTPFAAHLEVTSAPWAPAHRLVRIGLKGRDIGQAARPPANLVFLLDVSGSMDEPNKLPLVKQSLRLLVDKLRPDDRVAIAVYAGASGLALPSTPAAHKAEILDAIERLDAGGSTNGAMGIQLAYDIAKANFIPGGMNRVILATDGDFNVGVTSEGELVRLVQEKAKSGVFLTVLGFGMGNIKDATLEQLADQGNGNYAYIDTLAEARKSLVEQAGGTLVTIAKDVKIQVEFNPAVVQGYRLIGYENRLLAKEDFNNDQVDAGEVGAGHTVTALYEVVPVGVPMPDNVPDVDALKYQAVDRPPPVVSRKPRAESFPEMLTVKVRYKEPAGEASKLLEFPLHDTGKSFAQASVDFKFATAVAAFGMVLRESQYRGTATLDSVADWARQGLGSDAGGYRNEFVGLVARAQQLLH